jgi:hypothetical protein
MIPALLDLDNPIKDLCNFFVIYLLGRPVVQEHTTVKKNNCTDTAFGGNCNNIIKIKGNVNKLLSM